MSPGIAVNAAGNTVYVADSINNRVQVYTSAGVFQYTSGSGGINNGQFESPSGMTIDNLGNVYLADRGNHRIQIFSSNMTYLSSWSTGTISTIPVDVAVDSLGNVYVVDNAGDRIVKYSSTGEERESTGGYGATSDRMLSPYGIAIDANDNVYVADTNNDRIKKYVTID